MQPLTDLSSWVRPRNARFWAVVLLVAYTLAGIFLLPWLLKRELPTLAQDVLQRNASVAEVRFNPWSLVLEAKGFELKDVDGSALLSFESLHLNLQLSSVFRRALVLRDFRLSSPSVNLVREGPTETNLGRLTAAASSPETRAAEPAAGSGLPRLVIHQLEIAEGVLDLTDRVPATEFQTRAEPINIQLRNLSTLPDDQGDQIVRIVTEGDGLIEWQGTLQLNPLSSQGQISVSVPGLPLLTRYLDDVLDFDLDGGLLETTFDYQVGLQPDGFGARIGDFKLAIGETELATEESAEPFFGFRELKVSGGNLRWPEAQASIEAIVLTEPTLETWLDDQGELNLNRLLEERSETPSSESWPDPASSAPAGSVTDTAPGETVAGVAPQPPTEAAAPSSAASSSNDFTLSLGRLSVEGLRTSFEDRRLPEPGSITLSSLDLNVRDLNNTLDARFPFELEIEVLSGGSINAAGALRALPAIAADAEMTIEQLALGVAQPWLAPMTNAALDSGTLSGTSVLKSSPSEALDLRGQLTVDGVGVSDASGETLLRWQQLAITDLIFQATAQDLEIARMTLREPYARVEFDAEGRLNLAEALIDQTPAGGEVAAAEPAGDPFVFRMGTSAIENGSVDFSDLSLPLRFSTRIREFGGSLSALASDTLQPSELELDGRVGEFGQARLTGKLVALDPLAQSAVRLEFRNVNMPDLSPYTVEFAGRKVAAGKLNLDLDYSVDAAQLDGNNRIVIEQIKLGEKVDNPDALDLPLGLAIALLSDSNGVIDIELNIEGDANDPDFDAGGLIAETFANLILKAATSPFRLLAGLIGGGEDTDLQNVPFEAGSAALNPPVEEQLQQLGAALAQRPGLRLSIPGAYVAAADTTGIAAARIRALAEAALETTDSDDLLAERAEIVYEKLVRERLPELNLRSFRARFDIDDEDPETPDFDTLSYLTALRDALIAAETVSEAELKALGSARAEAIFNYLRSETTLAPERLRLEDVAATEPGKDHQVIIELALEHG